jgi:hypothetical protein
MPDQLNRDHPVLARARVINRGVRQEAVRAYRLTLLSLPTAARGLVPVEHRQHAQVFRAAG